MWPMHSVLGHPQESLGRNWEALDPIRMEERCYISCNRQNLMFKIQGKRPKTVKTALLRLRGCYFQISARQIDSQTLYILHPQSNYSRPLVKLVPEKRIEVGTVPRMRPQVDGIPEAPNIMDSKIEMETIKVCLSSEHISHYTLMQYV